MKWASEISRNDDLTDAFEEAADALEPELGGDAPDLLLVFASPDHADGFGRIAGLAERRFPGALLIGCTASGVIGGAHEAEVGPALSVTAAVLPGVAISGFHVDPGPVPHSVESASTWRDRVGCAPEERPNFLLLADPFTADADGIVEALDGAYPGAPKFGGLASGGRRATENRLVVGTDVHRTGAVAVVFRGEVEVDTLVAQGCRPIGSPMIVTRCQPRLLERLDGRPPLQVVSELYHSLDARDRDLVQQSLFLGIEMRSDVVEHEAGELLVRNILAIDQDSGAFVVGAELRSMMVVQFVVRDPHSAEEELRRMLISQRRSGRPKGALLFSCVGRGAGLFGFPDHDTSLFEEQLGPAPLGGFFCNGEIGPVGGTTFLHGYTSAFAIFREPHAAGAPPRSGAH